jgi:hypothetical protein
MLTSCAHDANSAPKALPAGLGWWAVESGGPPAAICWWETDNLAWRVRGA